ncbi:hypothetical protein [Bradyrhizobium sp. NBAIM14]|uniref:hypothetical protein n=1 Tax=Bradyrhizobium sp. NBAIM14 TaxID=2793814 RepID=UPI001CD55D63|nr:hypothetical protein [Bradyrhizobium sp. NBAIM14]MCA1500093.1 hypothetical protein [Bradyrhizobium sp. NBAIM14]
MEIGKDSACESATQNRRIGYRRAMPETKMPTIDDLKARGFVIECLSHARAILSVDFPDALTELAVVLSGATIPIEEIIAGGGEAKGTQRLRRAFTELKWPKTTGSNFS